MFWLFGTADRPVRLALLAATAILLAPSVATSKGKRHLHPAGFSFELPDGWTAENGQQVAMVVPKGVRVDPGREDNPEIYTVWGTAPGAATDDAEFISGLRENFLAQGIKLDLDGRPEAFGRNGSIYTFDFVHPARKAPFRVRIFSLKAKGRTIALIATGLRDRVISRDKPLRELAATLDYIR